MSVDVQEEMGEDLAEVGVIPFVACCVRPDAHLDAVWLAVWLAAWLDGYDGHGRHVRPGA